MKVILVCGTQASGKSTITKQYKDLGYTVLNRDTEGGKIVGLLPKMEQLLKDQKNIILDNTFAQAEVRKPFIELVKKYKTEIHCIIMDTSIEDAQFNFLERMLKLEGRMLSMEEIKKSKHPNIFPPLVFFKYRKEYQKPTFEEGFDSITTKKFVRQDNLEFTEKALICDYDSTLRECIGGNGKYPVNEDQIQIMPNRTKVLKEYQAKGYHLLGVSNQSGIHKGELTYQRAVDLFQHTNKLLGVDIDVVFCPHQSKPINCYCRKPQILHGVNFIHKYKLNRKECLFIGDYGTDRSFSLRCGFQYVDQADFFK